MRNYAEETEKRIAFIRQAVADAHADGIIFGNSGGKDSALVGILCKMACENTEGVILPCSSKRNFTIDKDDGMEVADQFGIKTRVIDLTAQKELAMETISQVATLSEAAIGNIAPRLRMMTLYAIGASENRLVAGTGNASEYYMGYFTKWGDGAYDLNPIADLTATEVFEFLRYLKAPEAVITKAPSAGLFEGQTDEEDMGVTYAAIDRYIITGEANDHDKAIIDRYHARSGHKRRNPLRYGEEYAGGSLRCTGRQRISYYFGFDRAAGPPPTEHGRGPPLFSFPQEGGRP